MRRAIRSSLLVLALTLAGCSFGFRSGGGLPAEIKTVAVLPFDNETSDATLGQQVNVAVREAVERRLGLRAATEAKADLVVRGRITRYEPDEPTSFSGTGVRRQRPGHPAAALRHHRDRNGRQQGRADDFPGPRAHVRRGDYEPGREADGRKKALEFLVTAIVDKAQSQW
ncbi:MAG: LPS assembly lipoprotein LptE [Gemmatimonadales bacterium]